MCMLIPVCAQVKPLHSLRNTAHVCDRYYDSFNSIYKQEQMHNIIVRVREVYDSVAQNLVGIGEHLF